MPLARWLPPPAATRSVLPLDLASLFLPEPLPQGDRIAPAGVRPHDWQIGAHDFVRGWHPPVGDSPDLQRVLAIARRPVVDLEADSDESRGAALVELMTSRLARPNDKCRCAELRGRSFKGDPCIKSLKPVQAWALWEASVSGGLCGLIGVGHGKTGLDILAPMVVPGCRVAVILIPPGLRGQLVRDYELWSQHFRVPSLITDDGVGGHIVSGAPALHVVPYSRLSRPESTALLEGIGPDTIIADEADRLRHPRTAGTGRFLRYLAEHPRTRLVWWSGTPTSTSIRDYAHLSAWALRDGSPVPIDHNIVAEWALAIDPSDNPAPVGKLIQLCKPGEHIHEGFGRRLRETRGVVSTKGGAVSIPLYLRERKTTLPPKLAAMLRVLRDPDVEGGWTRPDGEELTDILSVQACARQLACGFYYRWRYPRGESEQLIAEWFRKRKSWHKEVRERLKDPREHLDSPKLCENAAERWRLGRPDRENAPTWAAQTWTAWREIADQVQPVPEAVWVDDWLARDAAEWARSRKGVVWYVNTAWGRLVAELAGLPLHGGGPDAEREILREDGSRSVIASVKAHGRGRDGLQWRFCEQLIQFPPSSGSEIEQLLGRLHRVGQDAPAVGGWVYRHSMEICDALDSAHRKARYIQGTMGTLQKLLSIETDFAIGSD